MRIITAVEEMTIYALYCVRLFFYKLHFDCRRSNFNFNLIIADGILTYDEEECFVNSVYLLYQHRSFVESLLNEDYTMMVSNVQGSFHLLNSKVRLAN